MDKLIGVSDIIRRCQTDTGFLALIISDPDRALEGMNVDPGLRQSLATNNVSRLLALVDLGVLQPGCGSHGTCDVTCLVTAMNVGPTG